LPTPNKAPPAAAIGTNSGPNARPAAPATAASFPTADKSRLAFFSSNSPVPTTAPPINPKPAPGSPPDILPYARPARASDPIIPVSVTTSLEAPNLIT
jgi:hypothetical protein